MPRRMRFQSLLLTLTMLVGTVASAAPAHAALVRGTASVDLREVLAGEQEAFVFTVTNGGTAGNPIQAGDSPINFVRISAPSLDDSFTIAGGSADTDNWTFDIHPSGDARFVAKDGYSVAPGSSDAFTVVANSASLPEDFDAEWVVRASSDNGVNMLRQNPSSPGALTTAIRVLEVESVDFTSPAGILDGSATAGQNNVQITTPVTNHGSAPLSVTPSLSTSGGDTVTSVAPASASISPGATQDFVYTLTLGGSSGSNTRQFTGDASAPGANAVDAVSNPLQVEPASAFTYVNNSLTPLASPSGIAQTFRLSLNKTQPPSVTLDAGTVLSFTKVGETTPAFSTPLANNPSTGRGSQSVGLEFAPVTIPSGANIDGLYTPSLAIHGTDDNGADVTRTVTVGNQFEIDNLVPVLKPTLAAPSGQLTPDNQPVVKNGDTLTIGGQARKGPEDTDPVDSSVTITDCTLVVTNDDFAPVTTIPVPVGASGCRNNAGTLAGSSAPAALGVDSGWVSVRMVGKDSAGNISTCCDSNSVRIDNIAPALDEAITGCGAEGFASGSCNELRTIRINLTEPVKGQFVPTDFTVDDNTVTNSEARNSANPTMPCMEVKGGVTPGEEIGDIPSVAPPAVNVSFCDVVVLTLAEDLDEDATPGVSYEFTPVPQRARPQDGPKQNLGDQALDAIDGIVPDLPSLDSVSQGLNGDFKGAQGGKFYTNQDSPTFRITDLGIGYTAIVALDNNGNGDYDEGSDTVVSNCGESTGASIDCVATGFGADGDKDILITALDPDGNLAEGKDAGSPDLLGKHGRPETLVLDHVAPTAESFANAAATRTVSVTFSEELSNDGRNSADDWSAYVIKGSRTVTLAVQSVSGTDLVRSVKIDDTDPNWTTGADIVKYFAPTVGQYQDRAGNFLADFVL